MQLRGTCHCIRGNVGDIKMTQTGRDVEKRKNSYAYKAFISYSHSDEKKARALHHQLEHFRIPKALGINRKTLRPIFRDRDDLSATAGLNETLREALRLSENLIVLCSPHAAASRWVNDEVIYFKQLGRADKIYTVILDGEPFASRRSHLNLSECLPKAIQYKLADNGELSTERAEPLAADFRDQGDGKKLGLLKLVSGLLGVKLDELVRRDLTNSRRRFAAVLVSSTVIISLMGSLSWVAMVSQKEAYARKADAENFVEFMLSDLRTELETFGRFDLMENAGDKVAGYYEQFDLNELDADDDSNGRRARALHFIGELKYKLGETDEADVYFKKAYAITKEAAKLAPSNSDRIREHAISAYLRSKTLRSHEKRADEMIFLEEYAGLANRLTELDPQSKDASVYLGTAKTNLGRLKLRTGQTEEAKADLETADALFRDLTRVSPSAKNTLSHAENLAWLAEAYRVLKKKNQVFLIRQRQVDILHSDYKRSPSDFRLLEGLVYAEIGLGNAARDIGNYEKAMASHNFVLVEAKKLLVMEPGREKMMRAKVAALLGLLYTSYELKNFESCRAYRSKITNIQNGPIVTSLKDSLYWTKHLPETLSKFDNKFDKVVMAPDMPARLRP